MNKTLAVCTIALLSLAACGGSDSGGSASGVQGEAAQQAIAAAKDEGIELDEGCVNDLASKLSDDDAQAIVDAGPDGDAELSDDGTALTFDLLDCADADALIDQMVEGMKASGQDIDEACARDALKGVDLKALASDDGEMPSDLISKLVKCIDISGS